MLDDVKIKPASPPSSPVKKGRGRPRSVTTESPQERIERLEAELRHAHEAKKIAEQRRAVLVGSVVLIHAATDDDFRSQLAVVIRMAVTLRADVKSKADRAALYELAAELDSALDEPPSS